MQDLVPPALLAAALALSASGLLDAAGLTGASQGLAVGAAICAPLWLLRLWRRSRERRDDR